MKPVKFDYYAPASVIEALDTLAELGYNGKVLAGGQSLIAAMNFRMARPAALVDLNNIPELSYIKPTQEGGLAIGTMTRVRTVENDPEVAKRFPLLPEVSKFIAHPQIRTRGTFGGAIAHADPAGQLPSYECQCIDPRQRKRTLGFCIRPHHRTLHDCDRTG
jgi:CO/xanthine dehydrogenase FAD-binding subunit